MLFVTITLIVLGTLSILFLLFLFLIFPALRRHPDRQMLEGRYIAHRGLHDVAVPQSGDPSGGADCSGAAPENSLTAFAYAAEHGYMIENDIHITKDGEVVVFHDDDLFRMTGVHGKPEDMTLADLKTLRLAGTDERIPTLRECLDVVSGRVPLLIEFKCIDRATCDRLCPAAASVLADYTGKYLIQSFYPLVLSYYRKHHPDICRGQLSKGFYKEPLYMKLLGCLVYNFLARPDFVSYDHEDATHPCRRFCTALGAYPVGWTFRSEDELKAHGHWFHTFIFEGFIPQPKGDHIS